ncbi:D-alanyl-D-alanine carboxypeptidase, partial [Alkalihalophilus lindianensis]|nr:D-alanyl-D-alanine carboxypeptidase [Alkalihalophilus lindianensis]
KAWKTKLITHHIMLKGEYPYPGITGGKTGYVTESKQTLATTANNGKIKLTAVVLKSNLKRDKYDDTARLFDYGFKTFQHSTINQGEIFKKDSQEFHPNSDILVTEDVHGITKDVSNSGILSIKNNRGEVLQTVQLKSMERKPQAAAAVKKDKPKEKAAPKH